MTNRFTINSSHQSFTNKQRDLFALLENAEKSARTQLQSNQEMQVDNPTEEKPNPDIERRRERRECGERSRANSRNPHMRQYKSRESIFKRPEAPITRCLPHGKVPSFRKHPKQWTKYTLEDVKDEDMSDRSNSQAAFAFLKSIEKNNADLDEKCTTLPEKIVFKKSTILKKLQVSDEDRLQEDNQKSSFRSTKLVMPEYVVGQATKLNKKKKNSTLAAKGAEASKTQLKLNHLNDFDDESEDL